MDVREISFSKAEQLVKSYHYLGTLPSNCSYNFGAFNENGRLSAAACFGPCVAQKANKFEFLELRRLVRKPGENDIILSSFLARSLKIPKKVYKIRAVLSYADPEFHHGGIYQATNWVYINPIKFGNHTFVDEKGKRWHPRTVYAHFGTQSVPRVLGLNPGWTSFLPKPKYRYVMPLCLTKEKTLSILSSKELPYPKPNAGRPLDEIAPSDCEAGVTPVARSKLYLDNGSEQKYFPNLQHERGLQMPNIILRHFSVAQKETAVSGGDGYTGAVHFAFDVENVEVFDMNQLVLDMNEAFKGSIERSSSPAKAADDDEEEETPRRSRRAKQDDEEEEKPRRSRRAKPDDEEEEKPRRSRRAKQNDEEEEKPRRSRRAKQDDEEEEEEKPRRSRRAKRDDDAADDGKITDEHLNKVASRAAAVLTPKRVTAVMDEYGVTDLSKMKQSVRAEFIEQLEAEVAEEDADG